MRDVKEIVYSQERHPMAEGKLFANPRHFAGPVEGVDVAYIVGDHPKIAAAYRDAGARVVSVGQEPIMGTLLCGSDDENQMTASGRDWDQLPDDWRELPIQELRAIARDAGARFAINRKQAVNAIENAILRHKEHDQDAAETAE